MCLETCQIYNLQIYIYYYVFDTYTWIHGLIRWLISEIYCLKILDYYKTVVATMTNEEIFLRFERKIYRMLVINVYTLPKTKEKEQK